MAQSGKIEQQKILRVFKLINLLRGNVGKTVHRLAELLETDARTIYRYFKLLEALGFRVEKEFSKYKLAEFPGSLDTLNYATFSAEESQWLKEIIESKGKKNLLKDSILQKLQLRSELREGTDELFKANLGRFIDQIGKAIEDQKQIWLKEYYSLHSDSVSDRLIEPVAFSKNYEFIHGFEPESNSMKVFKIERIGEVVVSKDDWKHEKLHQVPEESFFGYTGKKRFHVRLKLSKKAYQLMLEEHPNARPFMKVENRNHYYFEGDIPQLPGLGRFILGLPGEIRVERGEEMKEYLAAQLSKVNY
ncbi:helix-turn-helix transcriptional regulator [Algoriphagus limi]|uniref:WYL domain-containing protein n=1 Tax=Algoriphagus limi TaxID=2975273 RepID=A0ABT2G2R4_9BACT|nr:WYL domain-containing protein [Algoriphagus limi]MCS5489557.1 WYL domain-containing protein [Algoriphagus limi]